MDDRTNSLRKLNEDSYYLNVVQIPVLRGLGSIILCSYVLFYDVLINPPFSLFRYSEFVAIFAAYCVGSWLILRSGYRKVRPFDLSLTFLIIDLFFWILVIYRTGADKSMLFFLSIVHVCDQASTTFKRVLLF